MIAPSTTGRLLPLASTGCSCCRPTAPGTDRTADGGATPAPTTSTTYRVDGMTCGGCAGRVSKAITALGDVAEVRVELAGAGSSAVVVTGPADPEEVRAAIEAAGYTVVGG